MEKMNETINWIFPDLQIDLAKPNTEKFEVCYTYIDRIEGIELKVLFQENSLNSASILFAYSYNDEKDVTVLNDYIEYIKNQIKLQNKEECMVRIQSALKEDGIKMSQNCTMDIIIGKGLKTEHILTF